MITVDETQPREFKFGTHIIFSSLVPMPLEKFTPKIEETIPSTEEYKISENHFKMLPPEAG